VTPRDARPIQEVTTDASVTTRFKAETHKTSPYESAYRRSVRQALELAADLAEQGMTAKAIRRRLSRVATIASELRNDPRAGFDLLDEVCHRLHGRESVKILLCPGCSCPNRVALDVAKQARRRGDRSLLVCDECRFEEIAASFDNASMA
jgi:hypothetical protein